MLIFIIGRKNNFININTYIEFLRSIIGVFCVLGQGIIKNKSPPTNRWILKIWWFGGN